MCRGIGEHGFLLIERLVLVGIDHRGGVELVDLEAQQIDLACPGALVTPQRRQFGVDLGEAGARGAQGSEIDPSELIERRPLRRRREQRLVGVLAVQIDDVRRDLGKRRRPWPADRRRRHATARRPGSPG